MKRILIVIPAFNMGGTNSSLLPMLNELMEKHPEYSIDILSLTSQGEFAGRFNSYNQITPNKITDYWYGAFSEIKGLRKLPAALVKIVKKINTYLNLDIEGFFFKLIASRIQPYDVVISYEEGPATRFGAYVRAQKHIAWVHCNLKFSIYDLSRYIDTYMRVDNVVCVSESARAAFCDLFPEPSNKSLVIYNNIDREKIQSLSRQMPDDLAAVSSAHLLVSVGRLDPIKQFDRIPAIASGLRDAGLNFSWLIVGDGKTNYRKTIESEITKYNVSDIVHLVGYKDNPYPYISAADIYVCTSRSEACPMVFLEANSLNTFILSSDFPSAHELLSPGSGDICCIEKMCENIDWILNNKTNSVTTDISIAAQSIDRIIDLIEK